MSPAGRRPPVALGAVLIMAGTIMLHPTQSPAEDKPRKAPSVRAAQKDGGSARRTTPGPQGAKACIYVVRQRDSVSRIAQRHGVSRSSLLEANGLKDHSVLRVGQRLVVPGCRTASPQVAHGSTTPPSGDVLVVRVGPLRIPTRFFLGQPERAAIPIGFVWPVEGPVASGFGRRQRGWHAGLDIKADMGTPIRAAASGVVSFSGWEPAYGRVIKIEHPHGIRTIYAHNLENHVAPGDWVEPGDLIGLVGRSGRTTGTHLHFEVRREELAHNPLFFLSPRDTAMLAAIGPTGQPPPRGAQ